MQVLSSQAYGLAGLFLLVLLDAVIGAVGAARTHTFSWSKLGGFTLNVLKHVGGMLVAAVMANGVPTLTQVTQPAWWTATIAVGLSVVLGDVAAKVHGLEGTANTSGTASTKE